MTNLRRVTDTMYVAPQIAPDDLSALAAEGFTLVINNRPEGEAPDQPSGSEIENAARAAGLNYLWIPVRGAPTPEQAAAVARAAREAAGKTLAFCRSGTRSINCWALGQALGGERPEALEPLGAAAGYDLSWLRSALR